jgi:hypothetical protein
VDCGLLHSFAKESDRRRYTRALHGVCQAQAMVYLMCFSSRQIFENDLPTLCGTHGVSEHELRTAFGSGWTFKSLKEVEEWPEHFVWFASIRRA